MGPIHHPLLIVSCKLLLRVEGSAQKLTVFRRLANLTRSGTHLLLTASEPDQWFPTRNNVDNVLTAQGRLQAYLREAGGDFDGVYYVPRSMFTQDRNRLGALKDILSRYGAEAEHAQLITSSKAFAKAAGRLGIEARLMDETDEGITQFEVLLRSLDS
jgi:hypothetical protein